MKLEKSRKAVKLIPQAESGAMKTIVTESGEQYIITQDCSKNKFVLYRVSDGCYERIATSQNSPVELTNYVRSCK